MNDTTIIPEIADEPRKAGCAEGLETIGYFAAEISRLRGELAKAREQRDRLAEALRVFLSRVYYQSVYMDGILRNASFNDRPKAEFDRELAEAREALAAVEGGEP
jgi:hypothetical protein